MDKQAVFNKVKNHLLTQNEQAKSSLSQACVYRTPSGLKCAIGCLIPDEVYREEFERNDVGRLLTEFPGLKPILGVETQEDIYFLGKLQSIHDLCYPSGWSKFLNDFAQVEGLEP